MGLFTNQSYHVGDVITTYGGYIRMRKDITQKTSHSRVIPQSSQKYVYDGYLFPNIELMQENSVSAESERKIYHIINTSTLSITYTTHVQ